MKKTILTLAILVGLSAINAFGQQAGRNRCFRDELLRSAVVDGETWYYEREVVQDAGSQPCRTNAIIAAAGDEKYMGDLSIPSSLGGCPVTEIGSCAFSRSAALTSIVIPDGVTHIGSSAFGGCESLVGVTLPSTLKVIGSDAFRGCVALTNVIIPSAVTHIRYDAFEECRSLVSVKLFEGLACIDNDAFNGCHALTSIMIPSTVDGIGRGAFSGCSSLTNAVISIGVKKIGSDAFSGCGLLTRFDVPSTVTSLGAGVLYRCGALTQLTVAEGNKNYKCINNCIVSANGKALIAVPLGCEHVSIPDGVREIPEYMFSNDKQLSDISLPNSIIHIGKGTFRGCHSLTNITIPASVKSIGEESFRRCISLRSVRFFGEKPIGVEKSVLPSEEELKKREEEWQKNARSADTKKQNASEQEKENAEFALWKTWPRWPSFLDHNIVNECELSNNFVLVNFGTNEWYKGCGKSCVVRMGVGLVDAKLGERNDVWERYDANGGLVHIARCELFPEYVWMTNRAEQIGIEMQKKWAIEHGMTYEEAKQKYKNYQAKNAASAQSGLQGNIRRPNFLGGWRGRGSLRERRMERERQRAAAAKAVAEDAQREAERAAERADREREEQRAQLLKIQEELKKAREAKAADVSSEG